MYTKLVYTFNEWKAIKKLFIYREGKLTYWYFWYFYGLFWKLATIIGKGLMLLHYFFKEKQTWKEAINIKHTEALIEDVIQ